MSDDTLETSRRTVPSESPESTLDGIYQVLSDPIRRSAVSYLGEEQRPISKAELLDEIKPDVSQGEPNRSNRLAVQFHHNHLEKLVSADLVEYDRQTGVIEPTEKTARASELVSRF